MGIAQPFFGQSSWLLKIVSQETINIDWLWKVLFLGLIYHFWALLGRVKKGVLHRSPQIPIWVWDLKTQSQIDPLGWPFGSTVIIVKLCFQLFWPCLIYCTYFQSSWLDHKIINNIFLYYNNKDVKPGKSIAPRGAAELSSFLKYDKEFAETTTHRLSNRLMGP